MNLTTLKQERNKSLRRGGILRNCSMDTSLWSTVIGAPSSMRTNVSKGCAGHEFGVYLDSRDIKHIPSRRNNPQTNGKIERWFQEYGKHRSRFGSAEEFMDWYNNRLHGALRLEWGERPCEAFVRKLRPRRIIGIFFE